MNSGTTPRSSNEKRVDAIAESSFCSRPDPSGNMAFTRSLGERRFRPSRIAHRDVRGSQRERRRIRSAHCTMEIHANMAARTLSILIPLYNEEEFVGTLLERVLDRKSTRLNSSHRCISYAVFCLKKK